MNVYADQMILSYTPFYFVYCWSLKSWNSNLNKTTIIINKSGYSAGKTTFILDLIKRRNELSSKEITKVVYVVGQDQVAFHDFAKDNKMLYLLLIGTHRSVHRKRLLYLTTWVFH
jgi:hypothetical protein